MISPEQFWQALADQGLLTPAKLDAIRAKVAAKPAIAQSAVSIARVLVANKLLTKQQARSILSDATHGAAESAPPEISIAQSPVKTAPLRGRARILGWSFCGIVGIGIIVFLATRHSQPDLPKALPIQQADKTPATEEHRYQLTESSDALWERPTPGDPIALPLLPSDTQMIVRVRLQELLARPHGRQVFQSLGPDAGTLLNQWAEKLDVQLEELVTLTLYLLPQGTTFPLVLIEGQFTESRQAATHFQELGEANQQNITKLATNGLWCPRDFPQHFIYGELERIQTLPQSTPGLLRREFKQLHQETHSTDAITILANPNFLRDEAMGLFSGLKRRFLNGLFEFWSDEAQAIALGYQHEDLALLEIRMIARDDMQPRQLEARVRRFAQDLPAKVNDFLGKAELDRYWQPLALRYSAMISFLVNQSRSVVEGKQVAINTIAPPEATHNLLLATELSLLTPVQVSANNDQPTTVSSLDEILAAKTTVRFSQKSLDEAVNGIAEQIAEDYPNLPFGVRLQIVGADLEPEGITRNQQIRDFDFSNVPLSVVLTNLMQKANPVQNLDSAASPEQKLVWVRGKQPGLILITTRKAAEQQSFNLPAAFQ